MADARTALWLLATWAAGAAFLFVLYVGLDAVMRDGAVKTVLQWLFAGIAITLFGGIPTVRRGGRPPTWPSHWCSHSG